MAFNEDIVRGVRRGAILLVALLIGVATYRILHAMALAPGDAQPEASAPAVEEQPVLALGPPVVPPPPPKEPSVVHHGTVGRPLAQSSVPAPSPVESAAPVDRETGTDQPSRMADQDEEQIAIQDSEEGDSQTVSVRRLRWMRAMGQYLRVAARNAAHNGDVPF